MDISSGNVDVFGTLSRRVGSVSKSQTSKPCKSAEYNKRRLSKNSSRFTDVASREANANGEMMHANLPAVEVLVKNEENAGVEVRLRLGPAMVRLDTPLFLETGQ